MSDTGSIIDALETLCRSALGDLPTGTDGWERGIRAAEDLLTGRLPHVFAHDPTEDATELQVGLQEQIRGQVQLDLWTRNETQEQVLVRLDSIRNAVKADRTLGGLVDFASCARRSVLEAQLGEKRERAGVLLVQWRKVIR